MLLYETRDSLRGHAVVPRALGVDEHGGAVATDAQAADLGAVAGVWTGEQALVLQQLLEGLPGGKARLRRAAARSGAKKHVPAVAANAMFLNRRLKVAVHVLHDDSASRQQAQSTKSQDWMRRADAERWTKS